MVLAVLSLVAGSRRIATAQSPWTEAWNSATAGPYSFNIDGEAFVPGDRGTWHIQDVDGAPSGNQVVVESIGGNMRLKLTCINGGALQASLQPLSIPLSPGMRLAISETGSLITPFWNGAFPTVFPPAGDNVHLMLQDNRGNMLVYLFQRASNYPLHDTTIPGSNSVTGGLVSLGYREVFADAANASGGDYLLNVYDDFSLVTGFVASGASIQFIEFMASGTASATGVATMDDLQIGSSLTATPPNATVQPQNQTARYGESALFVAAATGTAPFSYQWRRNGSDIGGATQMTLAISNVTLAAQGVYSVLVANQVSAVTSLVATLTVDARPYLLTQPMGQSVGSGEAVSLGVQAGGAPTLTYQWQRDQTDLPGQVGATLNIPSAATSNSGTYSVVVSNSFGFTESLGAVLTVLPPLSFGDAADAPQLVWTNGGDLPWKPQRLTTFDGVDALEAGPLVLSHSAPQTGWIETVVSGPGILSFRWRVSGFYLSLFVNDTLQAQITGPTDWQEVRLALGKGPQRIRWSFDANAIIDYGSYKAWLDQVRVLPRATSTEFANPNPIQIPISGSGVPYPSVIQVAGMVNEITEVVVHLNQLTMNIDAGDLDVLLEAPSGEKSIVLSDTAWAYGISNATLQLDDFALLVLPRESYGSGVFLPTDYSSSPDIFASPAPPGPYVHTNAAFRGANPNGQWRLFSRNDSHFGGSGQIAGGWSLDLLTRRDSIRLENARLWGLEAQFVLTGPPAVGFEVQVSSNMFDWVSILTNNIPPQGWFPFQDDRPAASAGRFYRTAIVQPSPPTIVLQPRSQTVSGGTSAFFSVTAASPWPLNYQWLKNNVAIGDATNATLTLPQVNGSDSGIFGVVVSNLYGSVNSSNASLTVLVPVNDAFANRLPISGMTNTTTGSNLNATKETGEPNHAGQFGGKSVWWTWTAPATGTVTMDTIGSLFDTLLAVYTGTSVSSLTEVASDDQSGGFNTSKLTFVCVAGTTYQIAVDGNFGSSYGDNGTIILNLNVALPGPPTIATQPQSQTVAPGTDVTFFVVATSPWPISYQWSKDNVAIGGATTATLTLTNVQSGDIGSYNVVVRNTYASITSSNAALAVVLVPNDMFANRIVISGMTNTVTGSNVGATSEAGEQTVAGYGGGQSVWWTWTAPANGPVRVNTLGSSFDTVLAVYTGDSVGSLTQVASDTGSTSYVTFSGVAGTTYQIAVDGYRGRSGSIVLNLQQAVLLPPQITVHPQSQNLIAGDNVTFTVTASGAPPLTYQWRKGGLALPGATNTQYTIVDVQTNDSDNYSVVVTNSLGSVTSSNAILTVTPNGIGTGSGVFTFITFAGLAGSAGLVEGPGSEARFSHPSGIAIDAFGNVLVADSGNNMISYIGPGRMVNAIWGYASNPSGVAVDTNQNIYVSDTGYHRISQFRVGGSDSVLSWSLFQPTELTLAKSGSLYVADLNRIVKFTPNGGNWIPTTLAGNLSSGYSDGPATNALFSGPSGLAVDDKGVVYVADTGNHVIRKILPDGTVTTLAGQFPYTGWVDGIGGQARFDSPYGLAIDPKGNLVVTDAAMHTIRQVTPSGVVSTLAGQPGLYGSTDGAGSSALFFGPKGVAVDSLGNIYVTDQGNSTIRKGSP